MADKKELTIEESFSKLEEILGKMEDDETYWEIRTNFCKSRSGICLKVWYQASVVQW